MTQNVDTANLVAELSPDATGRTADLVEIMRAYNRVTERLQASHEQLNAEVVRLQQELASANAALQRSRRLAALGEMAAGIAHEIRNPLASIQLYARMLHEDLADRPEQCDLAQKIGQAVRGLDAIVHDVLTVSREVRLNRQSDSAEQLLRVAVESQRALLESSDVRVVVDVDSALCFEHDADAMRRVLVNLIRNAVQAMADGGTLTLCAERTGDAVELVVRDTGPGIDDDAIDRIFNPFFTTRHSGTGLGLTIVHRIVEAHGGTICVHNDGGAVFTILIPLHGPSEADSVCVKGSMP